MRLGGMKLVHVLARDGSHLQVPKLRPKISLDNSLHGGLRPRLVLSLDLLAHLAVEGVIDSRRCAEGLPFARGIAPIDGNRLQDLLRLGARRLGGDLAVLANREPPRSSILVAVASKIVAPAAGHHPDAESGELAIV